MRYMAIYIRSPNNRKSKLFIITYYISISWHNVCSIMYRSIYKNVYTFCIRGYSMVIGKPIVSSISDSPSQEIFLSIPGKGPSFGAQQCINAHNEALKKQCLSKAQSIL